MLDVGHFLFLLFTIYNKTLTVNTIAQHQGHEPGTNLENDKLINFDDKIKFKRFSLLLLLIIQ